MKLLCYCDGNSRDPLVSKIPRDFTTAYIPSVQSSEVKNYVFPEMVVMLSLVESQLISTSRKYLL